MYEVLLVLNGGILMGLAIGFVYVRNLLKTLRISVADKTTELAGLQFHHNQLKEVVNNNATAFAAAVDETNNKLSKLNLVGLFSKSNPLV